MPETTNYKFAVDHTSDVDIARIVKENDNPKVFVVKYPTGGNTYVFKKSFIKGLPDSVNYSDIPLNQIGWAVPGVDGYVAWSIYPNEGKRQMEAAIEEALMYKPKIVHVKVFGAAK